MYVVADRNSRKEKQIQEGEKREGADFEKFVKVISSKNNTFRQFEFEVFQFEN
jgi:hypothetical protein